MREISRNIIVTGGKTGGHIYPALAIADILKNEHGVFPHYIGANNGMESKILAGEEIPFYGITLAPMVGLNLFKKIQNLGKNLLGFFSSLAIMQKLKPVLIIGTGGFVAGPVLSAAFLSRVPIIIHEQNVVPGVTNRILSHVAKEIWMTFNESANFFPKGKKKILTGMPLRNNFQRFTKEQGRAYLKINEGEKVLLIAGGSQGSQIINATIRPLYRALVKELGYRVIHITGPAFYEGIINSLTEEEEILVRENKLMIRDYLKEMDMTLNAADIIISRSGASFICELIATNSYSIQIPMKKSAHNHQLINAKSIEKAGLGRIIEEDNLTPNSLFNALKSLQPESFSTIIKNNVGILFGENTKEIIRKESGKYLNE